ncbi:hypothetical protein C1645_793628 [Glomus cerebriforme]|uniref:Uncharacterized protein n=1 Tax=Glomus cerebriforme TaxID=658196 RepID=A0A397S061_9GLOM|nr:hypothetical protein C1645_793628 [Glomus cerebriforme]
MLLVTTFYGQIFIGPIQGRMSLGYFIYIRLIFKFTQKISFTKVVKIFAFPTLEA